MRLLLVEDDSRVSCFIRKGLEAERYQVESAADGLRGIEMGLSGIYDLILMDIILPDENGIEACRRLREKGIRTPIMMITARDSVEEKVRGLEAGADDYLTKPFAFEELLARVRALLRRPEELELEPVYKVGDLSLDRSAHEVSRAGRPVDLTPTEFALLELLMRHPGRVLSRTIIEEQVWGYEHDPSTNVVDVYIRRLRQKIDDASDRPLIHTIRGVGYQLRAWAESGQAA